MSRSAMLAALALTVALPARAYDTTAARLEAGDDGTIALFLGMGWDHGSDVLVTALYEDGTEEPLRANEGFFFSGGVSFLKRRIGAVSLDTLTTIAVKGWNIGTDGNSVNYLVFPVEVLERFRYGQARLGVGISYLLAPRTTGVGEGAAYASDMKDSLGFEAEVEWVGQRIPGQAGFTFGLRFIRNTLDGDHLIAPVDASAVGVLMGIEY